MFGREHSILIRSTRLEAPRCQNLRSVCSLVYSYTQSGVLEVLSGNWLNGWMDEWAWAEVSQTHMSGLSEHLEYDTYLSWTGCVRRGSMTVTVINSLPLFGWLFPLYPRLCKARWMLPIWRLNDRYRDVLSIGPAHGNGSYYFLLHVDSLTCYLFLKLLEDMCHGFSYLYKTPVVLEMFKN